MGLRQGVTPVEENKLKHLASQGKTWAEVLKLNAEDSKAPLLDGVDLNTVKKNIWEPMVKKAEEAKKAGHPTIHAHEAAIAAKKRADKKAAEEAKK